MASIGNPVTILLVDDDESIRRFVRGILTGHRYQVIEASDGAEALDLASAHQGPIHLLLTDIIMPKLNGLVLAERLAQQRPETALRFMSGYIEARLVSANHPDAVLLQKPFTPDRLIETVRAALAS
jgi:two-component system, cell cycle sensor histidine kinase and response regulator CckA